MGQQGHTDSVSVGLLNPPVEPDIAGCFDGKNMLLHVAAILAAHVLHPMLQACIIMFLGAWAKPMSIRVMHLVSKHAAVLIVPQQYIVLGV